ncbi:hypothetical protein OC846_003938 [Tilletia horrida]|uniref:Uncharacterized protein n=1 Tax=Tilletia horrida TaxID=155126 RepID=A0AAN6JTD7_9BASI|nr:hypothetical protein OC846_003938 [Tilletia horrida]
MSGSSQPRAPKSSTSTNDSIGDELLEDHMEVDELEDTLADMSGEEEEDTPGSSSTSTARAARSASRSTSKPGSSRFDHPDIIHRVPIYLSLSCANIRASQMTPATGGQSPFPFPSKPSVSSSTSANQGPGQKPGPTLHAFGYPILPSRQPLPVPESARARNLRPTMRWKSRNNIVQIELPVDNHPDAYNEYRGEEYERGAERARKMTGAPGASDPLLPPTSSAASSSRGISSSATLQSAMAGSRSRSKDGSSSSGLSSSTNPHSTSGKLERTRLESLEIPAHYAETFVGVIRDGALHITPLDSTCHLRPTLHYLDALDDIEKQEKKRARAIAAQQAAAATASDMELSGLSSGGEESSSRPAPPPSSAAGKKAVNLSVTMRGEAGESRQRGGGGPGGGGGGGRFGVSSIGAGADARDALMGAVWDAESERWVDLEWYDEETEEAAKFYDTHLFATNSRPLKNQTRQAEYVCT